MTLLEMYEEVERARTGFRQILKKRAFGDGVMFLYKTRYRKCESAFEVLTMGENLCEIVDEVFKKEG